MSGFENNVINALNALIRAAIHSPNFVTGVSGWSINKDGSAEFNNLTIRGTFQGINFVINSNGIFLYDPVETLGNLVVSITAKAVTGPLGESVPAGITIGKATEIQLELYRDAANSAAFQKFLMNDARFTASVFDGGIVSNLFAAMFLNGSSHTTVGFRDNVALQFNSSDGTSSFANMLFRYYSDTNASFIYATMDGGGFAIRACSQITATDPTTGTNQANPAQSETWHDLRPLGSGFFGTVAGMLPPQYRKCPDGDIQIYGKVQSPAAAGNYNGLVWGTLAPGYRPNHSTQFPITAVADGAATPVMTVNTNGNLTFNFMPASLAQTQIGIYARFPLDNTGVIQS